MQKNSILFGLSLDEFWYGNPLLFYLYRDMYIDKMERQAKEADSQEWIGGLYSLRAFRQVMKEAGFFKSGSEDTNYPKKSFSQQEEEQKKREKNMALIVDAYMRSFMK